MTFLEAVNRIFQTNGIIRGDTDAVTSFSQIQHNASVNICKVAVQSELINLISDRLLPRERKNTGSITTVAGTYAYDLPTDFTRLYGYGVINRGDALLITQYEGGLPRLQIDDPDWKTTSGDPTAFYFYPIDSATKQIGFYPVPDKVQTLTFDYEASVLIYSESEDLPFQSDEESFSFVDMCARRFKFMYEDVENKKDIQAILDGDRSYISARARVIKMLKGINPTQVYGNCYE